MYDILIKYMFYINIQSFKLNVLKNRPFYLEKCTVVNKNIFGKTVVLVNLRPKSKTSNMKKVILSLVIVAVATFSAKAQDKKAQTMKDLTFSVGVDAGLPISDAGDYYSFVIGGDVQGEYATSPEL